MIGAEAGVLVRAARLTDGQGAATPQRDWENATRITKTGLSIQPAGTTDSRDSGTVNVTARWLLFDRTSPANDAWQAGDRFEWDGRTLEVAGDPQRWAGPRGGTHHWEVTLQEQPPARSAATGVAAILGEQIQAAAADARPWTP